MTTAFTRSAAALSACTAMFVLAVVGDAAAWTRETTVTGTHGRGYSVQGSAQCAGGVCSRSVTRTGPYGYSASRSGSVACAGGVCSRSVTRTGPYGHGVVRYGTVTRY
ncbi:hypothetical protein [Methylobrevis pamukkalensis]|uniref:Uncharacterized protein n=1 Tax=Methylobrevis pamukkalensis TaxID=1439726 RepID=A0A1E3H6L4_9HYPH|nr:hypothetical protein [Methylobrevis pamukkalensis]ODN71978.1 hypothetical protein A6302_00711 [Methylobrevis pamukkalensis]